MMHHNLEIAKACIFFRNCHLVVKDGNGIIIIVKISMNINDE